VLRQINPPHPLKKLRQSCLRINIGLNNLSLREVARIAMGPRVTITMPL
jgi:hypothetical protein